MNILKTFEIFLREPLSILKERFIQIVNINSELATQSSVSAELLERKAQITVMNSDRMYNLFQTVLYKRKMIDAQKTLPPPNKNEIVIGQLLKRG